MLRNRGAALQRLPLVLVVDDYEDTREMYASSLADAGYRVEQAANGQEALDAIARSKPALVLMDLSMPVLDGWEATKRIKSDASTSDVVVVAISGQGTDSGLRRATQAGADAVLTKPCAPAEVLVSIRALLGGE
ncbi:MAG: transcriptional regulator [Labilithrix sp.]|nr:transcriptional regulator [Labilithrix sp.]